MPPLFGLRSLSVRRIGVSLDSGGVLGRHVAGPPEEVVSAVAAALRSDGLRARC